MSSDIAVSINNVKKQFYLPNEREDSLKLRVINKLRGRYDKGNKEYNALKGISLDVKKGEFIGILGRNGAGKSTLLKIIAEIYQPTSGSIKVNGKLVPFIELGVGFNPNLSGRDNVYLNGAMLGFTRKEIDTMYEEIVEFAELKEFMDQKLKNYSSGMQVRLAFSVAIKANADILLLDEVLAVGDAAFQKKCYDYFNTLKDNGKTVILVTHSMANVRKFCTRAAVIDGGKVVFDGLPDEAAEKYLDLFNQEPKTNRQGSFDVKVVDLNVTKNSDYITVDYVLESSRRLDSVTVSVDIVNKSKGLITGIPGMYFNKNPITVNGIHNGRVVFRNMLFDGDYSIDMRISSVNDTVPVFDHWVGAFNVLIDNSGISSRMLYANLFDRDKSKL
jgi:ABC-2 type transport system ATP-binding protein